ncbi:hypothetical protein D3C85_1913340 [compost metagenome]
MRELWDARSQRGDVGDDEGQLKQAPLVVVAPETVLHEICHRLVHSEPGFIDDSLWVSLRAALTPGCA